MATDLIFGDLGPDARRTFRYTKSGGQPGTEIRIGRGESHDVSIKDLSFTGLIRVICKSGGAFKVRNQTDGAIYLEGVPGDVLEIGAEATWYIDHTLQASAELSIVLRVNAEAVPEIEGKPIIETTPEKSGWALWILIGISVLIVVFCGYMFVTMTSAEPSTPTFIDQFHDIEQSLVNLQPKPKSPTEKMLQLLREARWNEKRGSRNIAQRNYLELRTLTNQQTQNTTTNTKPATDEQTKVYDKLLTYVNQRLIALQNTTSLAD